MPRAWRQTGVLAAWPPRRIRLDSNDPEALYLFYMSFAHEDKGPSQNAIDALAAGVRQSAAIPTACARPGPAGLAGRAALTEAVAELKPIAYSPHGEKYAQKMRAWIQEIEAKKAPQLADATADESSDDGK